MAHRASAFGAALAALALAAGPAGACEPGGFGATPAALTPTASDAAGRAVAPVRVNGQGPFRFIIDTGANRSVLSAELAARLGLARAGMGEVHSILGAQSAPLVQVETLSLGAVALARGAMPILDGPMLDGEQGLLGVDGMVGRVLMVDFDRGCAEIHDAAGAAAPPGWHTIPGSVRFGSLIVTRGEIQGVTVNVLIDTGASMSLANERFRQALYRVRASRIDYVAGRAFTFGRPILFERSIWTPRLRMGPIMVSAVNAVVGDFHIFELWGLDDEPTLLIGMDVLANARAMAIDYERGLVHFRERPRGAW